MAFRSSFARCPRLRGSGPRNRGPGPRGLPARAQLIPAKPVESRGARRPAIPPVQIGELHTTTNHIAVDGL
eukprot:15482615-Alexandrium_andersonii.AAC.1